MHLRMPSPRDVAACAGDWARADRLTRCRQLCQRSGGLRRAESHARRRPLIAPEHDALVPGRRSDAIGTRYGHCVRQGSPSREQTAVACNKHPVHTPHHAVITYSPATPAKAPTKTVKIFISSSLQDTRPAGSPTE